MVFSDLFFLFAFLPAFVVCYLIAAALGRGNTLKNLVLVLFSLVFYAWGEPVYVLLMVATVVMNYFAGLAVDAAQSHRKAAMATAVAMNVAVLGVFKYAGFIATTLCDVGISVPVPQISLPIGISFYIFQSISYIVDVYRRESPVQRRFYNLLLYVSMFPQLIAGPIVRYGTVAEEITRRKVTADDVAEGVWRFIIGLTKKVVIANQLSEISSRLLTDGLPHLTTTGAWVGIVAFTLQIYYDFSGYSDMAIGMGRAMGFHFRENFDHPYCCRSITDFWRRWHISLGSFFRDYVYIPLGGNRRHQPLNILAVWFLTGMWHGASWNFILWGLYFGLIVMVEKHVRIKSHLYSMALVVIGWGIFYYDDLASLQTFFWAFFGMAPVFTDFMTESTLADSFWLWVAAIAFVMPLRRWSGRLLSAALSRWPVAHSTVRFALRATFSIVALGVSVALLVGATNNAFIYTRF